MILSKIKNEFEKTGIEIALSIANPLFGAIRIFIFTRIFGSDLLASISFALSSLALLSNLSLGGIPQLHFLHTVNSKKIIVDAISSYVALITSSIGVIILWLSTKENIINLWFVVALILNELFIIVNSGVLGKDEVRKNKIFDLTRNSFFVLVAFLLVLAGYYVGKDEVLIIYSIILIIILLYEYLINELWFEKEFPIQKVLHDGLKLLPVFASVWLFGYMLRLFSFEHLNSNSFNTLSIGLTYYDNIYVLTVSVISVYIPKYYSDNLDINITTKKILLACISVTMLSFLSYFMIVPILTDGKYILYTKDNIVYSISLIFKLLCYLKFQELMKKSQFNSIFIFFLASFIIELMLLLIMPIQTVFEYASIYSLTYIIYFISLYIYE